MKINLHHLSIAILTPSLFGLVLMLWSLFTANWIQLTYTPFVNITTKDGMVTKSTTSLSCMEGVFVKCCSTEIHQHHSFPKEYIAPWDGETTEHVCYRRGHHKNIHGECWGSTGTTQAFAVLSIICAFVGLLVSCVFACLKTLQEQTRLRLAQILLFGLAALCLIIVVALVGKKSQKILPNVSSTIGVSLILCVLAAGKALVAGVLATVAFVKARRSTQAPYAIF